MSSEEAKIRIFGIKFNDRVDYLIRKNTYKGMTGVDFRRFVMGNPTKQGIVIPLDKWDEFYQAIRKFNKFLKGENGHDIESDMDVRESPLVRKARENKLSQYMAERKKEKKLRDIDVEDIFLQS